MADDKDEVSVAYDASDIRSLYRACPRCGRNALWIAALPMLVFAFDFAREGRPINPFLYALPYLAFCLIIVLALYFVVPSLQVFSRRRNGWDEPMQVELNGLGIVTRHRLQDTKFHWSAIKNVTEKEGRLFLFTTPNCAIILPRRVFSDDAQFREWIDRAFSFWREATGSAKE